MNNRTKKVILMSYLNEGGSPTEQKEKVTNHMLIIPYPVAHVCHASLQKNKDDQTVQTVQIV